MKHLTLILTIFCIAALFAAAQKKTPTPLTKLPQKPVVQRQSSDASDEGLKGKVKTITDESEMPDYQTGKSVRNKDYQYHYDANGNLVLQLSFGEEGETPTRNEYGYINGARVRLVRTSDGQRPAGGFRPDPVSEDNAPKTPPAKPDNRYTTKYEYKYDNEHRLIEVIEYHNNSELSLRRTRSYFGDVVTDETFFGRSTVPAYRTTNTMNKDGNVVREVSEQLGERGSSKESTYKYLAFDKNGNWIKREFHSYLDGGNGRKAPYISTHYRAITYHP